MKRIDVKVGFLCNNQCKFCVQGDKRKLYKSKSREEIKEILKISSSSYNGVVFTGGEPTIRDDIAELVSFARSAGFKYIQIQTNGRMFAYKNFCKEITKAGANEFSPAVHGHKKEIHDFLTLCPGSFEQTIEGISNLKTLNQYILTNTVITNYNYKFLPEIAKLLVDFDVDQFQFAFPHILGRAKDNKDWLIPKMSEVINYVKKGLDIGIRAGKKVTTEAIPYCFMQGYEKYVAERIIPESKVFDADFVIEEYSSYRREKGKIKGLNCRYCKYYEICEGSWKEYPAYFGWEEFKPVIK